SARPSPPRASPILASAPRSMRATSSVARRGYSPQRRRLTLCSLGKGQRDVSAPVPPDNRKRDRRLWQNLAAVNPTAENPTIERHDPNAPGRPSGRTAVEP